MFQSNASMILEVILMGFPEMPEKCLLLFMLFFHIYVIASSGNLLILVVTKMDSNLQSPMYFFLGHLSAIDICYISATLPLMLAILISRHNHLKLSGCIVQMYTVVFMEGTECFLLAIMAYDRYAAICRPLHYSLIMKRGVCYKLLFGAILCSQLNSLLHTTLIIRLPLCDNKINHMFCDIPPLLKLSCIDTYINEAALFGVGAVFVGIGPLVFILISYIYIILTIFKTTCNVGRQKLFSTCVGHLIIVNVFYGTGSFTYVHPQSNDSSERDKLLSVIYNVATPLLNPIVYSLRNREVKKAVINACRKQFFYKGKL